MSYDPMLVFCEAYETMADGTRHKDATQFACRLSRCTFVRVSMTAVRVHADPDLEFEVDRDFSDITGRIERACYDDVGSRKPNPVEVLYFMKPQQPSKRNGRTS